MGSLPTSDRLGRLTEDLARDFYAEFRDESEVYFSELSQYVACLDLERSRIMADAEHISARYERFLADSERWDFDE